jgi:hypothetical protein
LVELRKDVVVDTNPFEHHAGNGVDAGLILTMSAGPNGDDSLVATL